MSRIPVANDIISFEKACGISPKTLFKVLSNTDNEGFAKLQYIKSGKVRELLIDRQKYNPNWETGQFKFHTL